MRDEEGPREGYGDMNRDQVMLGCGGMEGEC